MADHVEGKKMSRWKFVSSTVVICAAVFAFIYKHTTDIFNERINSKDDRIELLEKQNADLREFGVVPEAIKRLEDLLIPLTLAFPMDPFIGRIKIGAGQENPTEITMLIIKAEDLRTKKKFDLAAAKLDEIDALNPAFRGTPYFRFLIERDKSNDKEALALAEQAIGNFSYDARILPAYVFAVKAHLRNGNKKQAEDLCLTVIRLDPKNEKWREFFKQAFGYEPSVPKE